MLQTVTTPLNKFVKYNPFKISNLSVNPKKINVLNAHFHHFSARVRIGFVIFENFFVKNQFPNFLNVLLFSSFFRMKIY